MRILNKSKRTIDGIPPLKSVEIDETHAKHLKSLYGSDVEVIITGQNDSKVLEDQEKLTSRIEQLEKENKELQEIADEYEKSEAKIAAEKDKLKQENRKLTAQFDELKKEIVEMKESVKTKEAEAEQATPPAPPAPPAPPKKQK